MAVYKRGYRPYQGPLTGRWTRLLAIPRFEWRRLWRQRVPVIFTVVALVWPLLCFGFIYVSNHSELWFGLGSGITKMLKIDGKFFLAFMNAQALFAVVLAATAGPGLIAPDLANNALPMYFSRPMSRADYVLAKLLVLAGMLSLVTWVPGVALFGAQSSMAGWSWLSANWTLGGAIFAGFLIWILIVSLVALACSAYLKWRVVAGALVLGFFFVLAGVAQMVNVVLRISWASLLNPTWAMYRIWAEMLGVEPSPNDAGPGTTECVVILLALIVLLAVVLERKLRPVEVVQ